MPVRSGVSFSNRVEPASADDLGSKVVARTVGRSTEACGEFVSARGPQPLATGNTQAATAMMNDGNDDLPRAGRVEMFTI
jgi:hypothetical protein